MDQGLMSRCSNATIAITNLFRSLICGVTREQYTNKYVIYFKQLMGITKSLLNYIAILVLKPLKGKCQKCFFMTGFLIGDLVLTRPLLHHTLF